MFLYSTFPRRRETSQRFRSRQNNTVKHKNPLTFKLFSLHTLLLCAHGPAAVLRRSRGPSIIAKPKPGSSSSVSVIYLSYYSPLQQRNRRGGRKKGRKKKTKSHFTSEARAKQWERAGERQLGEVQPAPQRASRHSPHIVFNLILHMVSFQSESKALMLTNHNRSPLIRPATKDGCKRHSASPSLKIITSFTYKTLAGGKGIY